MSPLPASCSNLCSNSSSAAHDIAAFVHNSFVDGSIAARVWSSAHQHLASAAGPSSSRPATSPWDGPTTAAAYGRMTVVTADEPRADAPSSTYPDVLATRYAGADLVHVWSPTNKVVLERRLWLAVLRAQQELGIEVPEGAVTAYETVVEVVDLDSIRRREAVTRHDVKARIEEFSALAGYEQV